MPKVTTWVVKLGGAMLCAPELPAWLAACTGVCPVRETVVIGGGAGADEVRLRQGQEGFGDARAHRLAIEAMHRNTRAVMAMLPGLALRFARAADVQGGLWNPL